MKLRPWCVGCAIAVLVLVASNGSSAASSAKTVPDAPHSDRSQTTYRGGLITPPLAKPQFTLTDTSGAPFDFRHETEGYITLLFFGYTHCPDECPMHMAALAMGLRQLPHELRNQVKVVFVTADPARDSSTVLRAWLDHFDKRFIGLTGDAASIETAHRSAQVPAASKMALANRTYELAHASFVLAYTRDNMAHLLYPGGITPADWAHDLPLLVKETWPSH